MANAYTIELLLLFQNIVTKNTFGNMTMTSQSFTTKSKSFRIFIWAFLVHTHKQGPSLNIRMELLPHKNLLSMESIIIL